MPFVKLDCDILRSTLWLDREARDVFITALLMAEPRQITEPMEQIKVGSLDETGWIVQPGWYGFVPASGPGLVRLSGCDDSEGMRALHRLGEPESESRSRDFEGRRLVRVDGGFIVLNFMKYRDKDFGAAERMRLLRLRKKAGVTPNIKTVTRNSDGVTPNSDVGRVQSTEYRKTERTEAKPSGPANPLIEGRRPDMEREGYRLIREINALEPDRDPAEILIEAARWETKDGHSRTKVRLETMSDDHLIRTVHDLRSILEDVGRKRGTQAAAGIQQQS